MNRSPWLERLVVASAALVTVWGIGSYGIWDPWELASSRATELSFALFGVSEATARLPSVLGGLLTGALGYAVLRYAVSRQAGLIALVVLASTPLFLLNARLSMGDSAGMAAQAWVGANALAVSAAGLRPRRAAVLYLLLAIGIAASISVSGVLLGPLPPLLAVAAWLFVSEGRGSHPVSRWVFPLASALMAVGVVRAVIEDAPEYSHWLGGGAIGGDPPTWDAALELLFHGFAPWSAVLPIAATWAMWPRAERSEVAQRTAAVLLLWTAFAFVSWTLFASRYGTPPWLAVLPLVGLTALWLAEASQGAAPRWLAAVAVAALTGLLIRDYALYPDSPLRVLAADTLSVPDVYRPAPRWAFVLSVVGVTTCLLLVSLGASKRPDHRRTTAWLRAQWEAGWPRRGWMIVAFSLLGACLVFGLMCFVLDLRIASVVIRGGRLAFFAPLALATLIFGLPWLPYLYGKLGGLRLYPVLAASLLVGAFTAWSFQPTLGSHFSPKPVYEAYAKLAKEREPLRTYRVPTTAASYYTDAHVEAIDDRIVLLDFLRGGGQRWAVLPADELGKVNRAYRRETGRHLYVADARSARLLLIAAQPIAGRPNQSFIAEAVHSEPPAVQHEVVASFDERVELIGYDLDLPGGDSVGAGQRFSITWYWRVLRRPPAGYKIFVHIDADGLRLNGDHDPLDGRYPTKLWEPGDIIADAQRLTVPANFRTGDYAMYVGWFSGSNRLSVDSGPNDGTDRVRAGTLPVR
jgi:hypothetical protein